jgi:hypothetical protein
MDPLKADVVVLAKVAADHLEYLTDMSGRQRSLASGITHQLRNLTTASPESEILKAYQSACTSGLFQSDARFFLMQKVIHDCAVIDELEDSFDEEWDGEESSEGGRSSVEAAVYARHGEVEMSQLCLEDPDEFDRRRISGYSYFFESPSENKGVGYLWMDIVAEWAKAKSRRK